MTGLFYTVKSELSVGRLKPCNIVCENVSEMSKRHIVIFNDNGACTLLMEGKNGGYVNGRFVRFSERLELEYGDEIVVFGLRIMWLKDCVAISSEIITEIDLNECKEEIIHEKLTQHNDSFIQSAEFLKPPRTYYSIDKGMIELMAPPEKSREVKQPLLLTIGPAFTMALPMICGFLVSRMAVKGNAASSPFMYTGIITAIMSGILGSIWGFSNINNREKQALINEKRRKSVYMDYVKTSELLIKERYNKNAGNLRLMYPEISEYLGDGINKYLLWNRLRTDDDFLTARLGIGSVPCEMNISIPKDRFSLVEDELKDLPKHLKKKYSSLNDVPVTVDFKRERNIGITCENEGFYEEVFLDIILSLAVNVSPNDLKFVCLFENKIISDSCLQNIRFLPHLYDRGEWLLGADSYGNNIIIKNLSADIKNGETDMNYIIFTDCYEKITDVVREYENGYFACFSKGFYNLPPECRFIIQRDRQFSGFISLSKDNSKRLTVYFDKVSQKDAGKYSRLLQSVNIKMNDKEFVIPDRVGFFELYGKEIKESDILDFWSKSDMTHDISVPIGIKQSGDVLYIDFHEKGMGPHGLIAGMTGSGKSEVLQTIVLSLSVKYPPDMLGFFLIDYKGGGMSKCFENLPHLLGSISNLSGRMVFRAMASVSSENKRRQKIFSSLNINNISEYICLYRAGKVDEVLPHIFIIVDEFAELKREEPEFMQELISVARVGRSLGIHLILATQKPAGIVDDNIQSNSRFRICLRLQDKSDSGEVIHKPDAAFIKNPGRAYLQVGNDEIYELFQSAYTMDKSSGDKLFDKVKITDGFFRELDKIKPDDTNVENIMPQLKRTLLCISNADKNAAFKKPKPLWLKPLESEIFFNKSRNKNERRENYDVGIGVYDDPSHQRQEELFINVLKNGHHIILGTLQSGKSTLLTGISYALSVNAKSEPVNIFIIDYSRGMLKPFKEWCMCGAYICEENEEDTQKLFIAMEKILTERKEALKGGNFRQYINANNEDMCPVILVIDGIGAFRERTGGDFDKSLENILKNGESLGVYVIASALSVSSSEIPKRMFDTFKTCLPLQLKDKYEYKEALLTESSDITLPESLRGRGLVNTENGVMEFQAYKVLKSDNDFELMSLMEDEIKRINDEILNDNDRLRLKGLIKKVPTIPMPLTLNSFIGELKTREIISDTGITGGVDKIPVGFFKKSGEVFFIPNTPGGKVIVSGRSKSGKSNLIRVYEYICSEYAHQTDIMTKMYEYSESRPFDELLKIKNEAGDDPYVIHMGGGLDRQNAFDFSYIPYSRQTEIKKPGEGIVRKTSKEYEYGEILIPKV